MRSAARSIRAAVSLGVSPVSTSSMSLWRISPRSRPPWTPRSSQFGGLVVGRPARSPPLLPEARSRRRSRRGWARASRGRVCRAAMVSASVANAARVWALAAPAAVAVNRRAEWDTSRPGSSASDRSSETDPGGFRRRRVEPGQDEEFAGAGSRDIPEPDALAVQLVLFGVASDVVALGRHAQDRAIEGLGLAVDDRALRRHHAGHRVDGNDDGPFEPFGGVHGEERDGFFLRVRSAFDGAVIHPSRPPSSSQRRRAGRARRSRSTSSDRGRRSRARVRFGCDSAGEEAAAPASHRQPARAARGASCCCTPVGAGASRGCRA